MPTNALRRERTHEARVTIVFVGAVLVLVLLGFARIYAVEQDIRADQATACALRMAGRANTNVHERIPLKGALNYLASLGEPGTKQADPKKRQAAREFVAQFQAWADAVQPLPNPEC